MLGHVWPSLVQLVQVRGSLYQVRTDYASLGQVSAV